MEKIEIFQKGDYTLVVNQSNFNWLLGKDELQAVATNLQSGQVASSKEKALKQYLEFPIAKPNCSWCLDRIKSVSLVPTLQCNLSCTHCFYSSSPKAIQEWDEETTKAVKNLLKKHPFGTVTVTGGEPFMFSGTPNLIDFLLKETDSNVCIMTNGVKIPLQQFEYWQKNWPNRLYIQISLDGVTNEHFRKMRNINVEPVIRNIKKLKSFGCKLDLSFTLTELNEADFFKFVKFAEELDVGMHFPFLEHFGRALEKGVKAATNLHNMMKFLIYYKFHKNPAIKVSFIDSIASSIREKSLITHCGAGDNQISVFPDGSIYPCSELNDPHFRIAYIKDIKTPEELGLKIRQTQTNRGCGSNVSDTVCKSCAFTYLCAGNCRAESIKIKKDFFASPNRGRCSFLKTIYETILWEIALAQTNDQEFREKELYESAVLDYLNEMEPAIP